MVVVPDIGVNKTKLKSSVSSLFTELIAISPAFNDVAFVVVFPNKNREQISSNFFILFLFFFKGKKFDFILKI